MTVSAAVVTMSGCCFAALLAVPTTAGRARSRLAVVCATAAGRQRWQCPRRRTMVVAGSALVLVAVGVLGLDVTVVLASVGAACWWALDRARGRQRVEATRSAVIEMCRAAAAELRAGQPAGAALTAGGQLLPGAAREALAPAFAAARQGAEGELAELLIAAADAPGLAGLRRLAACWGVAATAGAALAPALERIAEGLQDERDVTRDIATALAGPRATVRLLAALPVVGLLLGVAVGAHPVAFLVGNQLGWCCLIGAAALDLAGLSWARRIAASAARPG
jgi:tight adherence protein B